MSKGNYVSGGRFPHVDLFDEWEMSIARAAVAKFRAKYPWIRFPETEDLLQECLTQWYFTRSSYRQGSDASMRTYMSRVVGLKLKAILREESAYKRRLNHVAYSLDEPRSESGESLADIVADGKVLPDTALLSDVRAATEELTSLQRCICRLLVQGYSVRSIAGILGKPRTTVRRHLKRIRETFLKKGLAGHL